GSWHGYLRTAESCQIAVGGVRPPGGIGEWGGRDGNTELLPSQTGPEEDWIARNSEQGVDPRSQTPVWERPLAKLRFGPRRAVERETEFRQSSFPNRSLGTRKAGRPDLRNVSL